MPRERAVDYTKNKTHAEIIRKNIDTLEKAHIIIESFSVGRGNDRGAKRLIYILNRIPELIKLTRRELGICVGMSREHVCRMIGSLKKEHSLTADDEIERYVGEPKT